jgi:hypothetical protein
VRWGALSLSSRECDPSLPLMPFRTSTCDTDWPGPELRRPDIQSTRAVRMPLLADACMGRAPVRFETGLVMSLHGPGPDSCKEPSGYQPALGSGPGSGGGGRVCPCAARESRPALQTVRSGSTFGQVRHDTRSSQLWGFEPQLKGRSLETMEVPPTFTPTPRFAISAPMAATAGCEPPVESFPHQPLIPIQEAWIEVLLEQRDDLRRLAEREIGRDLDSRGDAWDMVQETCLEALRDLGKFHGTTRAEFLCWLRKILVHNVRSFARRPRGVVRPAQDRPGREGP